MKKPFSEDLTPGLERGLHIFLLVAIALGVIGFFVGTRQSFEGAQNLTGYVDREAVLPTGTHEESLPARSYMELLSQPFEKNLHWRQSLGEISAQQIANATPPNRTPETFAAAIDDRASLRAYDGAPPVIPHSIRQTGATECMACHGEGLQIDGKVATKMSHQFLTNCTQCHVSQNGPLPFDEIAPENLLLDNQFVGIKRLVVAERASDISPPMIPHTTWMRDDCLSCHGQQGREGIRTTHPERQNCVQCHAPSATLDQRPAQPLSNFWE